MWRRLMVGALVAALAAGLVVGLAPAAGATSVSLGLSQATAFSFLGHSCGGIREQAFATGFDPTSGYPVGDVYLQTRCGGSGRGGGYRTTTYSAWVAVTWDFRGAPASTIRVASAPTVSPTFSAFDSRGDRVHNVLTATNVLPANCTVATTTYCGYSAYLDVVAPGTPTGVAARQVGDQFQVTWVADPATAPVVASSTVTATPVGSSAPILTLIVTAPSTSALVGPLQPLTTYSITVVSTNAGGTSLASTPITAATPASSVVPSAPTGVAAHWTAPGLPGDALAANWIAAIPGDSPIDQYQIYVFVNDPGNPVPKPSLQTLSGSTLATSIVVDDTYDWTVRVRAHNTAGWGPWSAATVLPAA
jgi:hypothetical protein